MVGRFRKEDGSGDEKRKEMVCLPMGDFLYGSKRSNLPRSRFSCQGDARFEMKRREDLGVDVN